MTTVGEICNRGVVTIGKTDPVLEAARRMREHHVGSLVIVDESAGKALPTGIITDRDIVVSVLATASPYLDSLQVAEVSTDPLVTAREDEDLLDLLKKMRAEGIRRVPVVDDEGVLQGIIAFDDLLEVLSDQLSELTALVTRQQRREVQRRI
ncbi:signal transduction protein [Sorangium cellulosum]|uniref:Signal transduction protein n=1 Tax=Sorangium cellulosum TaxID=56 RepID=A0A4P2QAX9_SORCE|nr:CBS domain-containing protein [Sorangium cellulosum]AUX26844.1 signal transduction protein [Sorangium cellulosum]